MAREPHSVENVILFRFNFNILGDSDRPYVVSIIVDDDVVVWACRVDSICAFDFECAQIGKYAAAPKYECARVEWSG